jgi:hypothetical protein
VDLASAWTGSTDEQRAGKASSDALLGSWSTPCLSDDTSTQAIMIIKEHGLFESRVETFQGPNCDPAKMLMKMVTTGSYSDKPATPGEETITPQHRHVAFEVAKCQLWKFEPGKNAGVERDAPKVHKTEELWVDLQQRDQVQMSDSDGSNVMSLKRIDDVK